ncbi:hypothetical protein OEZ74_26070, partial [Leclercia adecarboxylata]|uniref:hypothetical protein n=1 Tax=Leclercia adecarboxylata TaxID=83655 RepID=UPI00234C5A55
TVAKQAERYADEDLFSHVIFSGLDKPNPKYVTFQVDLDIGKNAIAYDAVAPVVQEEEGSENTTQSTEETGTEITETVEAVPVPQDDSL